MSLRAVFCCAVCLTSCAPPPDPSAAPAEPTGTPPADPVPPGDDDDDDDVSVPDTPTGDTGAPGTTPTEPEGPDWDLAATTVYINLGDSLAAGYDAAGQYGYARLLHRNDDLLAPGYLGADLASVSSAQLVNIAESGATSGDILSNLRSASLPPALGGEVVVTISAGGNDFNDDPLVMLTAPLAAAVAAQVRANLRDMIAELRRVYGDPHIYVLDIQDPTDGTGSIPSQYDEGMCGVIQAVPGFLTPLGVSNLGVLNDAIADEAAAQGVELVGYHDHFLGHGLTSADGWMSDDCAHPTSLGHHHLRRLLWWHWTGQYL